MKKIPLTQGKFAIVDDEDYEWLSKRKWFSWERPGQSGYAVGHGKESRNEKMHRLVAEKIWGKMAVEGKEIDHINRNGYNNSRLNLRLVSRGENQQNTSPQKNSVSKYKGVWRHKEREKWVASIKKEGRKHHLGLFDNEIDAAEEYDRAACYYYEYPYLNFPENRQKYIKLGFSICERRQERRRLSSKYQGVSWAQTKQKWLVTIQSRGRSYFLGLFNDEIDAACAYDIRAQKLFGDKAQLNFPKNN